ncbi:MAG: NAD(P)-dependent oxidoreductase [Albidovulum sp.]|nr:NAD(P)-dependent oxidoreductase [Albidovulum sp.]MDE0530279.1 NAD(P)-dependent oxidoreductase [Albidovulum sp.]
MSETAIVGTGRMGTAFAKRLVETGYDVTVWNRTQSRTRAAADAGAKIASNLAAITACDVIILSLTDADAVDSIVGKLVGVGITGRVIVDMSTLLPGETGKIAARVVEAGADFVDCPIGGTVAPALKGQLLGMAGGTEAAFARAKPILEKLCKRVEHLGSAGSGSRMKLAVNLPLTIYWKTLSEALSMLEDSGISAEIAISLIADSSAGPAVLKNRAKVVIDTLGGADQPGTFDIAGLAKDLDLALLQAELMGKSMPLAKAARESYREALAAGLGQFDGSSLTRFLMEK